MPIFTETQLKANINSGEFFPVYFFYGEETFLVKTYAEKVKKKALENDPTDINLLELQGNPDMDMLSEHAETLPFFSDHKVIMINDFNPENADENNFEEFFRFLENLPDTTIIVFFLTGCKFSLRLSKVKNFLDKMGKIACVCEFKPLNKMKIGEIICRKVNKEKKIISPTNAEYLAEITGCDLNLASVESSKLCSYVREGEEITREIIDKMVEKKLETKIFSLSDAIIGGNVKKSMEILSQLFEQRVEPIAILATLSAVYSEYYADKTAYDKNISPQQVASDLGFTGAKASFAARKYSQASKMKLASLRKAAELIYNADIRLKSGKVDGNVLTEETVLKLIALN